MHRVTVRHLHHDAIRQLVPYITRELVDAKDWPKEMWGILGPKAYTIFDAAGNAKSSIKKPWQLPILGGTERVRHEIEHARDRGFTNATHHPLTHFCTRSYSPIRFGSSGKDPIHAPKTTKDDARRLLRDGGLSA